MTESEANKALELARQQIEEARVKGYAFFVDVACLTCAGPQRGVRKVAEMLKANVDAICAVVISEYAIRTARGNPRELMFFEKFIEEVKKSAKKA